MFLSDNGFFLFFALVFALFVCAGVCFDWGSIDLPQEHLPFFFNNNLDIKQLCQEDDSCPFKEVLMIKKCWGYEEECGEDNRLSNPYCTDTSGRRNYKKDNHNFKFWLKADFGYVLEKRKEMKVVCTPENMDDSSLECSKLTCHCRAKNIYIDLREKLELDHWRYPVFRDGQIGGHCHLDKEALKAEGGDNRPLSSWFAELENFSSLPFYPFKNGHCDVILDKPTYFMKLDAGVNLYHHYCDFFNLYVTQHVNNSFSKDVYIVIWDNGPYFDAFVDSWRAFTDHPVLRRSDFEGKRLCVRDALFSLLPRMSFGLYYSTPVVPGCYGSSLFQAFSQHMMHRLRIPQHGPLLHKIRVTFLDRKTKYRNVLNQDELISALRTIEEYDVSHVVYNRKEMPFLQQVEISHNSDIFIGMHGAGLTHMLFQPDWGAVNELYNCGDPVCYFDLARLRGLKYFTWETSEKLIQVDEGHPPNDGAHAKFTNYSFDVEEFVKLVAKAADYVRSHPAFMAARDNMIIDSHGKDEL